MAKGTVNKVIILGRMGADPEMRYMPSGAAVANLRVATNDGYKDKTSGEYVESTEWHRIVLFGKLAEIAGEYLKKGRMVYIEGRLRTNKWTDQSGAERYTTEIVASEMQLIAGGNNGGGSSGSAGGESSGASYPQNAPAAIASNSTSQATNASSSSSIPGMSAPMPTMEYAKFEDDDIPF